MNIAGAAVKGKRQFLWLCGVVRFVKSEWKTSGYPSLKGTCKIALLSGNDEPYGFMVMVFENKRLQLTRMRMAKR